MCATASPGPVIRRRARRHRVVGLPGPDSAAPRADLSLTQAQAAEIKARWAARAVTIPTPSMSAIAADYGISVTTVSNIVKGRVAAYRDAA